MKCPFCSEGDTQVRDTRVVDGGQTVKRRRVCLSCGGRFTTLETFVFQDFSVIKKSGHREAFSRTKMKNSVLAALSKPQAKDEVLVDRLIDSVIASLTSDKDGNVTSTQIGRRVLSALHEVDPVGFVRFASIYDGFETINDFHLLLDGELSKKSVFIKKDEYNGENDPCTE